MNKDIKIKNPFYIKIEFDEIIKKFLTNQSSLQPKNNLSKDDKHSCMN
jgi:hypothetical protein